MLRKKGVVGKFVEFFGPGLDSMRLAESRHRLPTWAEYGADVRHLPDRRGDVDLSAPDGPA